MAFPLPPPDDALLLPTSAIDSDVYDAPVSAPPTPLIPPNPWEPPTDTATPQSALYNPMYPGPEPPGNPRIPLGAGTQYQSLIHDMFFPFPQCTYKGSPEPPLVTRQETRAGSGEWAISVMPQPPKAGQAKSATAFWTGPGPRLEQIQFYIIYAAHVGRYIPAVSLSVAFETLTAAWWTELQFKYLPPAIRTRDDNVTAGLWLKPKSPTASCNNSWLNSTAPWHFNVLIDCRTGTLIESHLPLLMVIPKGSTLVPCARTGRPHVEIKGFIQTTPGVSYDIEFYRIVVISLTRQPYLPRKP